MNQREIMDDFKVIARLLAAIRASEESPVFDTALVDEKILKTTAVNRDLLAVKLQKAGYIEGLAIIDDIDNQTIPFVAWNNSKPAVTLEGMTWMQTNEPLRKAITELKGVGTSVAAQVVSDFIQRM